MIITFAGHSIVLSADKVKELVKNEIRKNSNNSETIQCYLGGYGDFDNICARACKELKQEYQRIEVIYISPYLTLSEQEKIKEFQRSGLYDSSIYPIENTPPKFSILKRNEWMILKSDLVIVYINHSYGGAYKTYQTALRRKKKIINICDFL